MYTFYVSMYVSVCLMQISSVCMYSNHNLQTSKAQLECKAQGTSLFTSVVCMLIMLANV